MYMDKDTLYEIRVFDAENYFLIDSTRRYIAKYSPDIKDLLHYPLEDYKCPQNLNSSKHYCYVLNNEFYACEQLLQSHPHLFI